MRPEQRQPELWERIERLYHEALERAEPERAAFLAEACAGDEELRREVESLLRFDRRAERFIEAPALEVAAQAQAEAGEETLIGQTLGHYRILSLLGEGGMSEVYLALDMRLERHVALKLLPEQFTQDADRLRRFIQEAKAASALNHPNIITIHDIGATESVHFVATEYVEGRTLRKLMTGAPLELGRALDVTTQIANALAAAHTAGIVHRDIKPENVMVRPDGYLKVLDFGIAKLKRQRDWDTDSGGKGETEGLRDGGTERQRDVEITSEINDLSVSSSLRLSVPLSLRLSDVQTAWGLVLGTAQYMSPEQARGQEVDERTDIFSLGVLIYEMIAGRRPFGGATRAEIIRAVIEREPPPLDEDVPAELREIVSRASAEGSRRALSIGLQTSRRSTIVETGVADERPSDADLSTEGLERGDSDYRQRGTRYQRSGVRVDHQCGEWFNSRRYWVPTRAIGAPPQTTCVDFAGAACARRGGVAGLFILSPGANRD